jgi:hypothetical protein
MWPLSTQKGKRIMWVLIVVINLQAGGVLTVPGYSSEAKCSAAGQEITQVFGPATPSGPKKGWLCKHVD